MSSTITSTGGKQELGTPMSGLPLQDYAPIFARAFAIFVAELAVQFENRGNPLVPAENSVCKESDFPAVLANAPDWIKHAYRAAQVPGPSSYPDLEATRTKYIAQRLRLAMKSQSVNQASLAKRLSMAPSQLSRILKNPTRSQLSTLTRIADELAVDVASMLSDVPEND